MGVLGLGFLGAAGFLEAVAEAFLVAFGFEFGDGVRPVSLSAVDVHPEGHRLGFEFFGAEADVAAPGGFEIGVEGLGFLLVLGDVVELVGEEFGERGAVEEVAVLVEIADGGEDDLAELEEKF